MQKGTFLQDQMITIAKPSSKHFQAAEALIVYGALVLHDSRVSENDNAAFLDLMEDYFNQPLVDLRKDERPELGHQLGFLGRGVRSQPLLWASDQECFAFVRCMDEKLPYETQFPVLNSSSNVVPSADFLKERWVGIMDQWGKSMKHAYVLDS